MTTENESGPKEVHPIVMDNSAGPAYDRPSWVSNRPAVGMNIHSGEPIDGVSQTNPPGPGEEEEAVINQFQTGDTPSLGEPGTPYTEDPDTGFETGTTSPTMEEKRLELVKENEKAAKEAAKAEKAAAKEADAPKATASSKA